MPIHHAVLGLLEDGPSYGYELKANLESAFYYRFAYGGPNSGDAVGGLVSADLTPHQPFFDTYMSALRSTDSSLG